MRPFIKIVYLCACFIFFTVISKAQDLASSYKPKNQTEKLIIAKIRALPEVKDFFKHFGNAKDAKPDFMINPPVSAWNNCYGMQIGMDYPDIFRTYFWLLIDPKTFNIYYWDFSVDSGSGMITLLQWRYWRTKPSFKKAHYYKEGKLIISEKEKHVKKKSSRP